MLSPTAPSGRLDAVLCEDREDGEGSPRLGFRTPGRTVRAWNSGSMEKQRRAWLVQKRKQRVRGDRCLVWVQREARAGLSIRKDLATFSNRQGPSLCSAERRKYCVKVLVGQLCRALQPHGARQAPLSMEFSRQEYCIGLPFPSRGDFSHPRDRTHFSCIAGRLFTI